MQWLEDDSGTKVQFGQPLYDGMTGELCRLAEDGDEVIIEDPFDGSEIHRYEMQMMIEECMVGEFYPINRQAVDEPVDFVQTILSNLLAGYREPLDGYNSWDLEYAMQAVEMTKKSE